MSFWVVLIWQTSITQKQFSFALGIIEILSTIPDLLPITRLAITWFSVLFLSIISRISVLWFKILPSVSLAEKAFCSIWISSWIIVSLTTFSSNWLVPKKYFPFIAVLEPVPSSSGHVTTLNIG